MEILETKERKMNKIKREERENLHTFSDTTIDFRISCEKNRRLTLYCICLPPIFVFLLN